MPLKDPIKRREYEKDRVKNKRHSNPEYREKTNAHSLKSIKKRIKNRYEHIESLKEKCIVCGENRKVCLEWHHRDALTKSYTITYMAHNSFKLEDILKEIEKCDVLCANCHKIEHAKIKEEEI